MSHEMVVSFEEFHASLMVFKSKEIAFTSLSIWYYSCCRHHFVHHLRARRSCQD